MKRDNNSHDVYGKHDAVKQLFYDENIMFERRKRSVIV